MYKVIEIKDDYIKFKGMIKGSQEKISFKFLEGNKLKFNLLKNFMFKEPKKNCGDSWSEKIATEIGKILKIDVQEVDLAVYNRKTGVLVTFSLNEGEELIEGLELLNRIITDFNEKEPYSFKKVKEALDSKDYRLYSKFIDIIFFDTLIGNTDRHCENWGIKLHNKDCVAYELVAAYDNSASLGRELHNNSKKKALLLSSNDKLEEYVDKNKSLITVNEDKIKISHFILFKDILGEDNTLIEKYKKKLKNLSEDKIEEIVDNIPLDFIERESQELVKKILIKRKEKILKILNGE